MTTMKQHVEWVDASQRVPLYAGKFVVEVDCGGNMVYTSTRSYNPTAWQTKGWMNMASNERILFWLDGLHSPGECVAIAQRRAAEDSA